MGPKKNEGWEESRVEDRWVPRLEPTGGMRKRFVPYDAAGRKSQEEMGLPRNLFEGERLEDAMEDGKRSFKMRGDLDVGWGAQSASRASDRDWKAAQAELDRAKPPEFRPGKALWNGSWYGLEEAIVNPVVQGGLRDSGQEWTLAVCLSDDVDITIAAMMGWSFPFPPKPGRMSTTGEQWNEAILRMQSQELIDEQVLGSATDYIRAQGVARDMVMLSKFERKIKSLQVVMVQRMLDLVDNDMKMPKLGMLTTRQHIERAAQSVAYENSKAVTVHQIMKVILECAKQGVKDAARLRREQMAQILKRPCREPHVMLESLQQFDDKKRTYTVEFATRLPDDFEEDLLRQQQEYAKISENAESAAEKIV